MEKSIKRLHEIIDDLYESGEVKDGLHLALDSEGLTSGIVEEVKALLERSIQKYEKNALAEINELEKELEQSEAEFSKELAAMEDKQKQAFLRELNQKHQEALSKIRGQLSNI